MCKSMLQCIVLQCPTISSDNYYIAMIQCSALHCSIPQFTVLPCTVVHHATVYYSALLSITVQFAVMQCSPPLGGNNYIAMVHVEWDTWDTSCSKWLEPPGYKAGQHRHAHWTVTQQSIGVHCTIEWDTWTQVVRNGWNRMDSWSPEYFGPFFLLN